MSETCDILVIGAGIAGASVAAHLAEKRKVNVLEMEERPGYHSTGRSAAAYEPNYGPAPIKALTRAARDFFESPPPGFTPEALTLPRPSIFLVPPQQQVAAKKMMAECVGLQEIGEAEARQRWPVLQPGYASYALLDAGTADIDVDLLHQGFLRLLKSRGGRVICDAAAAAITRQNGAWHASTAQGDFSAPIIVNAAGAWGDVVAGLAGIAPLGLQPKRRSIGVIPAPPGVATTGWPMVGDVGETWYAKPQSGKIIVSSADATPVDPHDAFADDMAVAEGIDRFQRASGFDVSHVEHSWGGLRTFPPDGSPVCGYDPVHEGFFWLVGQGGYGIQSSPTLSRVAAALVEHCEIPPDIAREGFKTMDLAPSRFRI